MKRVAKSKKSLIDYIKDNINEIDEKNCNVDLELQLKRKLKSKRVKKYIGIYRAHGINVTIKQNWDNVSYKYDKQHPIFLEIERTYANNYLLNGDISEIEYCRKNNTNKLMKRLYMTLRKFNKTHISKPICKIMATGMKIERVRRDNPAKLRQFGISVERLDEAKSTRIGIGCYNMIPHVIPVRNLACKRYKCR